ncbi:hypothetical protein SG09_59160 [Bradyrhizobium ottawaense]|uniref:hypothetical protein n=1 Tax=Bradyrhizobium TaxID=374 RepID=UPI001260E938|nr:MULTISPECIES: hypothetical protein [Bradyrhizobium]MBR0862730.1 hypothetical protein [Bradyrhizobium diazoefficiens]MBR0887307.1 hypothetical protein [Bradyrhizobium diazoefficiens]MBR0919130.1 hypothetical protein [Bradyrhizobium diazoefficiens]BBO06566.1 hypothetical protein SG09_59160 [Bradyrhizobium ottawaense]
MEHNNYTSTHNEVSTEKAPEGPTRIGGFTVCTNGLAAYRDHRGVHPRHPVRREEVEIAKDFMKLCRRMKSVQPTTCPINGTLKHDIERWARRYVGRGAVIVAALELGITIEPYYGIGPRDEDDDFEPCAAVIGINSRDVARIMREV